MKNNFITMICLLFSVLVSGQSKIEESKKALKKKPSSTSTNTENSSSSNQSSSSYSSNDNSFLENIFSEVFLEVLIYGTYGIVKYGVIGDYQNEQHLKNYLSKAPYYEGAYGHYTDSLGSKNFRIDLENSFMYDNKYSIGNHFKAKIRPSRHFSIQTDFRRLFEKNISGNISGNTKAGFSNQLNIYDVNLCYDRVRLPRFNLGWTLGLCYFGSGIDNGSIAVGVNADYFLKRNISFYGSAQWSTINETPVNFYELQAKFHKSRGFISLGYEYLVIGSPTYKFTTLGLGVYF